MLKVTIDLNVVLDFLNKRESHHEAAQILQIARDKKILAHIAAHEVTTLAYFLDKKSHNRKLSKKIISNLLNFLSVLPINKSILLKSLNSKVTDFEDAVIEISSYENNIDYIITRNLTDFKKSIVKVISPLEFLKETS